MNPPIEPELLLRENAWLRRLARSLAADPNAADDLVQDTWLAALERAPRAFGEGARAWMVAVAQNLVRADGRRRVRARERERSVARDEALPSVSESVERVAAQRELVDAVLALEPLERDLVVLRYFEDLPPRAIATRLGLSGSAVRSRLSRALARLRERLDRRFEGGRGAWAALLVPGGSELRPTSATSLPFWLAALGTGAVVVVVTVRALAPSSGSEAGAASHLIAAEPEPAPAGSEPSAKEPPAVAASSAQRVLAERAPSAPSAAAAASALTLAARFVDENGAPLAGVRLAHSTRGDEWSGESAESNAVGEVRIELSWPYHTGLIVGRQDWAWLKASGRPLAMQTWSVKLNGPGEQSLGEIRMAPGGSIVGRTVDEDGRPMESAFVTASGGYASESAAGIDEARTFGTNIRPLFGSDGRLHASTGADGRFELDGVPATDVAVHAVAAGFLGAFSALAPLAPGATMDVGEVVLARPGPENLITGTVRDEQGTPIAKVRIEYGSGGSWHGATDASGRFALQVPRERKYTLLFSRDEKGQDLVLADVPAGTLDLDVHLSDERWIEIVALGEEQEIAPIRALQLWGTNGVGLRATSEAQPDGRQRLRVPSEPFKIQLATPGWKNQKQGPFDPATVADRLVFPVQRVAGMSGRVLADGVPVAGARVHAHPHWGEGDSGICAGFHARFASSRTETRTDAEGRFRIPGDSAGTVTLDAELDGWARAELGPFEFVDGVERTGLDLVLQRGGTIEGRVLVAEGAEARGKIVGVGCGDAHVSTQELGADGTYRFEHLRPGEYQVLSVNPDYRFRLQRGQYIRADAADPVVWSATVRAGEVTRCDLDLRDRIPSRLTGELRFDGQASAGWSCSLSYRHDDGRYHADDYAHGGLVRGRFDLRVRRPGPFSLTLSGIVGPAEVRLHQTLALVPGDNSWQRDLATATLTLEHVPAFERTSSRDQEAPAYCLRWRDDPELTWTASLHEPPTSDGELTIPLVPAGHVQVLRRPEDASYGPDESWPIVLELDLTAGAHARVAFP